MKKKAATWMCMTALACMLAMPVSMAAPSPDDGQIQTEKPDTPQKEDKSPKTGEGWIVVYAGLTAAVAAAGAAGVARKRRES